MRFWPLLFICILSIPLATGEQTRKRRPSFRKQGSDSQHCQLSRKSSKLASSAATEAKAANDAQREASEKAGQRALDRLADKAEQAARSAEAALNGKKQLLEQLEQNLIEADAVIVEIQKSRASSRSNIDTVHRVATNIKNHLELMLRFLHESTLDLNKIAEVANHAQSEVFEKQMIRMQVDKWVKHLRFDVEKARKELSCTEKIAKKAADAAEEALQRVEIVDNIVRKLKILKKKDIRSLKRVS